MSRSVDPKDEPVRQIFELGAFESQLAFLRMWVPPKAGAIAACRINQHTIVGNSKHVQTGSMVVFAIRPPDHIRQK